MEKDYDRCIIQIGDCIVSSEIVTEFFACDYEACRGACCVIGDSGAPLEEWEPEEIERNYAAFSPLMSGAGREAVDRNGFFEIDPDGSMVTPLVRGHSSAGRNGSAEHCGGSVKHCYGSVENGGRSEEHRGGSVEHGGGSAGHYRRVGGPEDRECAYCLFERGNCFCAMERKWFAGKSSFRKPRSCHLYPIRVTMLADGMKALNFHRWDICKAAFEKGRRENIRVYEFLEEPIRLYFGSELYTALKQCAQHLL